MMSPGELRDCGRRGDGSAEAGAALSPVSTAPSAAAVGFYAWWLLLQFLS